MVKTLNKRLIGVLILILAVLLWLFFKPQSYTPKAHVPAHSLSTDDETKVDLSEGIKPIQVLEVEHTEIHDNTNDAETFDIDSLSYLAIYRMYREAWMCLNYNYTRQVAEVRQVEFNFVGEVSNSKRNSLLLADAKAEIARVYSSQCEAMLLKWVTVFEHDKYLNQSYELILDVLYNKKAKTKKEKQIKALLKNIKKVDHLKSRISEMIDGEDSWTSEQVAAAKEKIIQIRANIVFLQPETDDAAAVAHNSRAYNQINDIRQQLERQKNRDISGTQAMINETENLLYEAKELLNSQDHEVFMLAKFATDMSQAFEAAEFSLYDGLGDFFSQGKRLKQYSFTYTLPSIDFLRFSKLDKQIKYQYLTVIQAAGELYYCSLGADCGPHGALMIKKCLGYLGQSGRDEACGKSVMDYYFNGHLTAGQLYDVDWLLIAMGQFYAP